MEIPVTAKAALLQALLEGPGHPFELAERVMARTDGKVKLLSGSIYPALEKFVEAKLVVSYMARSAIRPSQLKSVLRPSQLTVDTRSKAFRENAKKGAGRAHDFYHLTEAGKQLAEEQRAILIGLAGKSAA